MTTTESQTMVQIPETAESKYFQKAHRQNKDVPDYIAGKFVREASFSGHQIDYFWYESYLLI